MILCFNYFYDLSVEVARHHQGFGASNQIVRVKAQSNLEIYSIIHASIAFIQSVNDMKPRNASISFMP